MGTRAGLQAEAAEPCEIQTAEDAEAEMGADVDPEALTIMASIDTLIQFAEFLQLNFQTCDGFHLVIFKV